MTLYYIASSFQLGLKYYSKILTMNYKESFVRQQSGSMI